MPQHMDMGTLKGYHELGWQLTPLWWITDDGHCACRRGPLCEPKARGKHPIMSEWQRRGLATWADIEGAWSGWPAANVGVLTGEASGHWVLDYDPAAAGPEARSLLELLGQPHVITGGGGFHWRFQGAGRSNSSGALPAGFDVRGDGGMVVAPPSISGKGPYRDARAGDPAPLAAPGWLNAMFRPPTTEKAPTPAGSAPTAYVRGAVDRILDEMRGLPQGRRNQEGWRLARRVREVCAAGAVDPETYRPHVLDALMSTGLPAFEVEAVWARSGRKEVEPTGPAAFAGTFTPPAGSAALQGPASAVSSPNATSVDFVDNPVDAFLAELLDPAELEKLPPPEWLVKGFLTRDSLARVNGAPGSMKSFTTLDIGMSVATGRPWQGHEVAQGTVWCVLGEGASGTDWRVKAWMADRGAGAQPAIKFLPRPVQAGDAYDWDTMVAAAARVRPALIILDTQSRITVGIKESDNTEMGLFVEAAERLRRASGACVLLVHHVNKGDESGEGRGAGVVKGALTTEMSVVKYGRDTVVVKVIKQKNAEEEQVKLRARVVDLGGGVSSLVLDHVADGGPAEANLEAPPGVTMDPMTARVYALVTGDGPLSEHEDFSTSQWLAVATERLRIKRSAYYSAVGRLRKLGVVAEITRGRYRVTTEQERTFDSDVAEAMKGQWILTPGQNG